MAYPVNVTKCRMVAFQLEHRTLCLSHILVSGDRGKDINTAYGIYYAQFYKL